jgi:hypothetical protein
LRFGAASRIATLDFQLNGFVTRKCDDEHVANEVLLGLIAVCGVLATPVVSYVISRQSANDLRANIDKEIVIIRKLAPGSPEVAKLEAHVTSSIDKLIERDERRARLIDVVRSAGPLPLLWLLIVIFSVWRQHPPAGWSASIEVVYWTIVVVFALAALRYSWTLLKLTLFVARHWIEMMSHKIDLRIRLFKLKRLGRSNRKIIGKLELDFISK